MISRSTGPEVYRRILRYSTRLRPPTAVERGHRARRPTGSKLPTGPVERQPPRAFAADKRI